MGALAHRGRPCRLKGSHMVSRAFLRAAYGARLIGNKARNTALLRTSYIDVSRLDGPLEHRVCDEAIGLP